MFSSAERIMFSHTPRGRGRKAMLRKGISSASTHVGSHRATIFDEVEQVEQVEEGEEVEAGWRTTMKRAG